MTDLDKWAHELAAQILNRCSLSFERDDAEELIVGALRAERKRALEEAERICRAVADSRNARGNWTGDSAATECADRIAGLERGE